MWGQSWKLAVLVLFVALGSPVSNLVGRLPMWPRSYPDHFRRSSLRNLRQCFSALHLVVVVKLASWIRGYLKRAFVSLGSTSLVSGDSPSS